MLASIAAQFITITCIYVAVLVYCGFVAEQQII